MLRLSLLRSPTWPDPETDQGHHEFTYSLYPHAGTWREAMTVRQGYELNYPLMTETTIQHHGFAAGSESFFATVQDNVIITAIKKTADDDALIVRFYEWAGKKGDVVLRLPWAATQAWETNLMEVPTAELQFDPPGYAADRPDEPVRDQDGEDKIRQR